MTMPQFRDAFVAEVHRRLPEAKIEVVAEDEISITRPDGTSIASYLDNAYAYYRQEPGTLSEVLARYVSTAIETLAQPPVTAAKLVVLVRPRSYLDAQEAAERSAANPQAKGPPLTKPFVGDLLLFVAVDQPTTFSFDPGAGLEAKLKMDQPAIWAAALANTKTRLESAQLDTSQPSVMLVTTGDGLAPSMMADDDHWDAPSKAGEGAWVVAPVAKDVLLVTHENDAKGVAALRIMASRSDAAPDGLDAGVYVRRAGAWVTLPP
jgi:hypothetical protein